MREDDTNPQPIEHSEGEHLGCTVVAIYGAAAGAGLVTLATMSILLGWWHGLLALAVIVTLSSILWALLRIGARGAH